MYPTKESYHPSMKDFVSSPVKTPTYAELQQMTRIERIRWWVQHTSNRGNSTMNVPRDPHTSSYKG